MCDVVAGAGLAVSVRAASRPGVKFMDSPYLALSYLDDAGYHFVECRHAGVQCLVLFRPESTALAQEWTKLVKCSVTRLSARNFQELITTSIRHGLTKGVIDWRKTEADCTVVDLKDLLATN